MANKMAVLVAMLVALSANIVGGLQCYDCTNVELSSDTSSMWSALAGKSNPSCGTNPFSANTVRCPSNYVCGSVSAQLSASSGLFGKLSAKTQVRGCMPPLDNSPLGGCRAGVSSSDALLTGLLRGLGEVRVSGEVCTCNFDLCTLCAGGIELAGTCVQYWVLGLSGAGVVLVLILLVTCCCCCCGCCGCCRNRRPGVIHSGPYHTLTVIQPSGSGGGSLSIQSGDVTSASPYTAGGAYTPTPGGAAFSGYNQPNDAATLHASYTVPAYMPSANPGSAGPGYAASGYNPTNQGPPGYNPTNQGPPGYNPTNQGPPGYKPVNQGPPGYKAANEGPPGYTDDGFGMEGVPETPKIV